jgi:Leucine-rich repeat (LRR) protein
MNKWNLTFFLFWLSLFGTAQVRFNSSDPTLFQKYGNPQSPVGKTTADLKVKNLGKLLIAGPILRKDLKAFNKQVQLELILLQGNGLASLPDEPFKSINLLAFSSKSNPLTELPISLLNNPTIMYLELVDTEIDSFPSTTDLPGLQLLRIINNKSDSLIFSDSLPGFPSLKSIEFFNVPLQKFPAFISRCPNLEQVILNGCRLDSIPENVSKLLKLNTIDLENNALNHLPVSLAALPSLRRLNVAKNQLSTFPEYLMYAPLLEELKVNGNPLHSEDVEILKIIGRATKTLID